MAKSKKNGIFIIIARASNIAVPTNIMGFVPVPVPVPVPFLSLLRFIKYLIKFLIELIISKIIMVKINI